MIRKCFAAALGLALLLGAGPAFSQSSVTVRKPDNSAAIDVANTANQTSQLAQETALNTVLGLQADAAWSGSGSGTLQAIQKYIAAKLEASRALLAGTLTVQFSGPQAVTQSGTWNITNISGTVSLPTGAATSAAQATASTTLSTIATNTTGASTAANQTSANTKLDQLHTDMIAATPAGTNLIGKVGLDQTTPGTTNGVVVNSSALPAGAATSAGQTTAQTSLTSIDGKTPALGQAAKAAGVPVTVASDQFQATSTSAGVTITTAGTFQSVLASSVTRKGCLIQNRSTDTEYVFVGANGSATTAASLELPSKAVLSCSVFGVQLTDNISMTSASVNGATAVVVSQ